VRVLSYDLRPPDLEHLGLVAAINLHCEEFAAAPHPGGISGRRHGGRPSGLRGCHQPLPHHPGRAGQRLAACAATVVEIRLVASFPKIILRMEDNGKGLMSPGRGRLAPGSRLGLVGMRERVAFLEGK